MWDDMLQNNRTGLLLIVGAAVCLAQGELREIDGAKTPDKIPDRYAYPVLFQNLIGPDSEEGRKVFLRDSRLSESDAMVVLRGAEEWEQLWTEGMSQLTAARKSAPRPLPAAVLELYGVWNTRMNDAVESNIRSFDREISAEGQKNLRDYLRNHIKRSVSVHLGDADIAAGFGPGTAGPQAGTRPMPGPIPASQYASAVQEAAQALVPLRVIEREKDATIQLWNGSPKPIAAFQIATCAPAMSPQTGLDTFGTSGPNVAIGAAYELEVSKRGRPGCDTLTPKTLAVIFQDGTGVGHPQELEQLKFGRLGMMAETERAYRILAAAGDAELPDWAVLRKQIGEMPESQESALQTIIEAGLAGFDANELKVASPSAQSALSGAVSRVRHNLLSEIDNLSLFRPVSVESQRAQWDSLRDKYRRQSEFIQAFRQQTVGSLYR
jgi:hypothetical protein